MPAGRRDAEALDVADRLTAAAEEMRRKATHLETVREIDATELDRLRSEVSEALSLLAEEVSSIKGTIRAIASAADAELKRRA